VSAAASLFAQAAAADTVVINGFTYANPLDAKISEAGRTIGELSRGGNVAPGKSLDVYAGAFSITDNGGSFSAYCADIYKYDAVNVATVYTPGGASELTAVFDSVKANNLGLLANKFYAGVDSATKSAAFQLATWEILFESSGSPYTLGADTFKASGGTAAIGSVANPSALSLAQSWLDNLAGAPVTGHYDINYLQVISGNQNLVYFTPSSGFVTSAIPEPETYAMILAGIGMMGLVVRRRKRND
jgi:hypothetical protein